MKPLTPIGTGIVGIFFMKGDEWMCRPSDNEYMLVDIT